jgi:predicted phosphodiesterase
LIHGHRPKEIERIYREPALDYDSPEITFFYDYLLAELPDSDVIVFGHFHQAVVYEYQGRLLINPGSADPNHPNRSIAVLETGVNGLEPRIVSF